MTDDDIMPIGGWRRGSVVRTSVFEWRTFPVIRPICDLW